LRRGGRDPARSDHASEASDSHVAAHAQRSPNHDARLEASSYGEANDGACRTKLKLPNGIDRARLRGTRGKSLCIAR